MHDPCSQLLYNVVGGIIVALLTSFLIFARWRLYNCLFRRVFGRDAAKGGKYCIAYSWLKLAPACDEHGRAVTHPYVKAGTRRPSELHCFSMENPVSGCEVRAINYLSALFGHARLAPPELVGDVGIESKHDLSFIALGGPASNVKTWDALENAANTLVKFDGSSFFVGEKPERLNLPTGYDYGLILKLQPEERNGRTWIVCAGIGEWGTSGAAWYLASEWRRILRMTVKWWKPLRIPRAFAVIVRVKKNSDDSATPIYLATADGKAIDTAPRLTRPCPQSESTLTMAGSGCPPPSDLPR